MQAKFEDIKEKIAKVQKAKNFLDEDFVANFDKKALTFRDFYKAGQSSSGEESDGSADSDPNLRKTLGKKWDLYEGQLKKVIGESPVKKAEPHTADSQRGGSSMRKSRDFIIKQAPSGTLSARKQSKGGQSRVFQEQKKLLGSIAGAGAKRPYLLSKQNDMIRGLIEGKDAADMISESKKDLSSVSFYKTKKVQSIRRNSQTRVIDKEMVLPEEPKKEPAKDLKRTSSTSAAQNSLLQTQKNPVPKKLTSSKPSVGSKAGKEDLDDSSSVSSTEIDFDSKDNWFTRMENKLRRQ